jgi:hypothetical protein
MQLTQTLVTANAIPLSAAFRPTRNILWQYHFNLWPFHSYPELPLALGKCSQLCVAANEAVKLFWCLPQHISLADSKRRFPDLAAME